MPRLLILHGGSDELDGKELELRAQGPEFTVISRMHSIWVQHSYRIEASEVRYYSQRPQPSVHGYWTGYTILGKHCQSTFGFYRVHVYDRMNDPITNLTIRQIAAELSKNTPSYTPKKDA